MRPLKVGFDRVLSVFLIAAIALCSAASFLAINVESVIVLIVFDFLFVSLTFQLSGSLTKKLALLASGNLVGFFSSVVFHTFRNVGVEIFGEPFGVFYVLSFPLLNMMWMVTFWSLSLAVLPKPQNEEN